jgi:hypothetical protein
MNRLPIEIENDIWNMYYKDIYSNVIKELNEYNEKISEYWIQQQFEACLDDWEIIRLKKLNPEFCKRREHPYYLLKNYINKN